LASSLFYKVENEQEAIDLANDPWPRWINLHKAMQVADQIDSGMIFINEPTTTQPDLPFGGTKGSGYGRIV
jgi:succinate-semialdehyde dehydrogenase/glutarate-semialdehyde dehydrogenase